MMMSEFIERVGFEPTAVEYQQIEQEYMGCDTDKDLFCKEWKKNGGVQRLCGIRARRIEELEAEVARKDKEYEEMDARHCRSFNQMNDALKERISEMEAKIKEYEKLTAIRYEEMASLKQEKAEVEENLETIRKAFAILGIGKGVQ